MVSQMFEYRCKSSVVAGALLWLACAVSVQAGPLALDDALSLAELNSPLLASANAATRSASAGVDTATAYPNPEVEFSRGRFNARFPRAGNPDTRTQVLGVAQPVEWPGVRSARREMAEAGLNASEAMRDQMRLELRAKVKLAYFDVVRREEERQLADQMRALLELIRNRIKLKVEVGEAPRYELVKAEAEALAADNAAKGAEMRVGQARSVLRSLLGFDAPQNFELTTPYPRLGELPEADALRREMLERHPQLRSVHADVKRAESRLALERNLRLPQPTVRWTSLSDPEMHQWLVGVTLPLPLWNRRAGPVGEALAGTEQSQADAERTRLALLNELDLALARYRIASSQVHTFESGLLQQAEMAMTTAEAAYRYGERNLLDYLDAQRMQRSVRLDFLSARYEQLAAWVDIERLRALSDPQEAQP